MRTEHALLNDSGDEGGRRPAADGKQGSVASVLALGHATATEALPDDPKLRGSTKSAASSSAASRR